ncbi:MAG: hypothetical protein ACOYN8_02545 [Pseudanabaena sp.]|jgi:trans-2-enoyl-CoA reductase
MTDSQRLEADLLALTRSIQTLVEEKRITNTNLSNLVDYLCTQNDLVALDVVDVKNEEA